ncbi:CLU domain [Trypanosoma melophagium]|uniref:CLU domain n=1 Tax=Trypanosoma melophagium TaxID=715481 RepID=UPI00351A0B6D|nr:CLU domain [Trypanosoma melophagium]
MDRAFLSACTEFYPSYRDWNAEFQLAWEMEDNTVSQAESRLEALRRVEREFVADAVRTVKQIVTLDDDGPREMPKFLQCYRVDNIFFRVLPDSRSGRNYVASLRGVLQSRTRLLTVPLSCMLFYRGMPVLAQALVPMPRQPTQLYGAGYANNHEVEAEILHMADALNIILPTHKNCEVYEGLDGRWYCTLTNTTTFPLGEVPCVSCPLKRQEMLARCAYVTSGPRDVLAVVHSPVFLDAITQLKRVSTTDVQFELCSTLHTYGVNLCYLKEVLRTFAEYQRTDVEALRVVESCIMVEMFARTIKQEFYLRIQSNRIAYDDVTLQNDLTRRIAYGLDESQFKRIFLPVIMRKYYISHEEEDIIALCDTVRLTRRHEIISRLSILLGARSRTESASAKEKIVWVPKVYSSVLPLFLEPKKIMDLAAYYDSTKTTANHMYAFCLPLQAKVKYWEGDFERSLDSARLVVAGEKVRDDHLSLPYLYALRDMCELLFGGVSIEHIEEGRKHLVTLLGGFQKLAGPLTLVRRYIECACWMLGSSDIVDMRSDALSCFQTAAKLLPSGLRSNYGAWLYIRPFLGQLRCKQAMSPLVMVDIVEIARDAKQLSALVTPSDFFAEYLWELGMELRCDAHYSAATKTLLTALRICKKVPNSQLDVNALTQDIIGTYHAWDPVKYGAYCDALLTALPDASSRNTSYPSDPFGGSLER